MIDSGVLQSQSQPLDTSPASSSGRVPPHSKNSPQAATYAAPHTWERTEEADEHIDAWGGPLSPLSPSRAVGFPIASGLTMAAYSRSLSEAEKHSFAEMERLAKDERHQRIAAQDAEHRDRGRQRTLAARQQQLDAMCAMEAQRQRNLELGHACRNERDEQNRIIADNRGQWQEHGRCVPTLRWPWECPSEIRAPGPAALSSYAVCKRPLPLVQATLPGARPGAVPPRSEKP